MAGPSGGPWGPRGGEVDLVTPELGTTISPGRQTSSLTGLLQGREMRRDAAGGGGRNGKRTVHTQKLA